MYSIVNIDGPNTMDGASITASPGVTVSCSQFPALTTSSRNSLLRPVHHLQPVPPLLTGSLGPSGPHSCSWSPTPCGPWASKTHTFYTAYPSLLGLFPFLSIVGAYVSGWSHITPPAAEFGSSSSSLQVSRCFETSPSPSHWSPVSHCFCGSDLLRDMYRQPPMENMRGTMAGGVCRGCVVQWTS